jgi:hypothetical protein
MTWPPSQSQADDKRVIVESLVKVIEWINDTSCYCECPGTLLHTTPEGDRGCKVHLDGAPTIYCFHSSCHEVVAKFNYDLRSRIGKGLGGPQLPVSPELILERLRAKREADERKGREAALRAQAHSALGEILHRFAWDEAAVIKDSPIPVPDESTQHWLYLLDALYNEEDVVWIGGKYDSGSPRHARNFERIRDWAKRGSPPGPLVCPAVLKPGVNSRSNENVVARPYLVLDGDSVDPVCAAKLKAKESLNDDDKARNFAACLAVINWLRLEVGLVLRAIVDAANKSAHGWFDFPDGETLADLGLIIGQLGFDPATFRESQPVRLPGVFRADSRRWQRLLFLNPSFIKS